MINNDYKKIYCQLNKYIYNNKRYLYFYRYIYMIISTKSEKISKVFEILLQAQSCFYTI